MAADKNVAKIRVAGLGNEPSSTFRLLNLLDKNKLNIDVMIQSLGKDGTKSVSFTVTKSDMLRALDLLNENKDYHAFCCICDRNRAGTSLSYNSSWKRKILLQTFARKNVVRGRSIMCSEK